MKKDMNRCYVIPTFLNIDYFARSVEQIGRLADEKNEIRERRQQVSKEVNDLRSEVRSLLEDARRSSLESMKTFSGVLERLVDLLGTEPGREELTIELKRAEGLAADVDACRKELQDAEDPSAAMEQLRQMNGLLTGLETSVVRSRAMVGDLVQEIYDSIKKLGEKGPALREKLADTLAFFDTAAIGGYEGDLRVIQEARALLERDESDT